MVDQNRRWRSVRQRLYCSERQLEIPALVDRSGPTPIRVFESGSILLYLADKFGALLPRDVAGRIETLNWLFWQMGSAPYLGGGFGHFYAYTSKKIEYAIDRFAMEAAPAIAGVIVDADSWNAVLLLNVPIGVAVLGILSLITPPRAPCIVRPDWLGLALICIGLPSLVYVLVEGSRWDWFEDSKIVWLSLIAGTALVSFVFWQRSPWNTSPLLDLKIFRHEEFAFGFVVSFVAGFALFGSAFLIPAFTLQVLQFPARDAGLVLLPSALTVGLGLLTSGSVIQFLRAPPVVIVPFGIAIFMTAMWLLSGSNAGSGYPDLVPTLVLRGFGMGLLFIAITIICLGDLTGAEIPHGVGLFNLGRQMGGLIGIAFLSTFLDHHMALSRTVIVSNLGRGSPVVAQALQGMEQGFASRGMGPEQAASAALVALDRMVNGQAAAISFNEAFLSLALLFIIAIPCLLVVKASLILLARRRREKAEVYIFDVSSKNNGPSWQMTYFFGP